MPLRLRRLAASLIATAALAGGAWAAAPACALLPGAAANGALGGSATMRDGGPEKDGYSDCAWNGPDGAVLTVLFWSAARFADGHASAAEKFDLVAADLRRRGTPRSGLSGVADKVLIVDQGSPGLEAAGIALLKGGQVVQITGLNVSVEAAMGAAEAVAAALPATPPELAIVPRPKPPEIAALPPEAPPEAPPEMPSETPPEQPPAEPPAAPTPPPVEPQPQPEPTPPPAEPQPQPEPPVAEPQPQPEPPAPEPQPEPQPVPPPAEPQPQPEPPAAEPQPPVAEPQPQPPAPDPQPEPQPEPQPTPPPAEPQPEPQPEPPPIRPTDEPAALKGSPACLLLPSKALEALLPGGAFRMEDRGPAVDGESSCRWSRARDAIGVSLTLLEGVAISSAAESASAYFDQLEGPGPDNGIETLAGVGDRAYLQTLGSGDYATYSLSILKGERIVFLNLTGTGREAAIKLGLAAAKAM